MSKLRQRLVLAPRLATLGADWKASAHLFVAGAVEGLKPGWHGKHPMRTHVKLSGRRFRVVLADSSDFLVLGAMRAEEFKIDLPHPPKVIVDLGAHIGLMSLYFRARYPEAKIFSLEPNPVTFERLRENTADHDIEVRHGAVTGQNGTVRIFTNESSWSSSLIALEDAGEGVDVEGITLDSLLAGWGIEDVDLLKFDIEGAEFDVLRNTGALPKVTAVVAELHYDLAPSSEAEVRELLSGFKITNHPQGTSRAILHAVR